MTLEYTEYGRSGMVNDFLSVSSFSDNDIVLPEGASVVGILVSTLCFVTFRTNKSEADRRVPLGSGGIHYIADITRISAVTDSAAVWLALVRE